MSTAEIASGAKASRTASAPDPADDRLMHHDYDGIREYDNPLPFWWKGIFVVCIAHAAAYLYWFHLGGPGLSEHEQYAARHKEWKAVRAAAPQEQVTIDEAALTALTKDSAAVERGRGVFLKNCASCHTEDGRGLVGPNLTDRFQVHGATRLDLWQTIQTGVPDKGMLSWGPILPPAELAAVAAFVVTLRGTEVAGGKASEGHSVEPFR